MRACGERRGGVVRGALPSAGGNGGAAVPADAGLGLSHLTRSGMRATAFGILGIGAFEVLPHFFPEVEIVVPSGARMGLWRTSCTPQAVAVFHHATQGLVYLTIGAAVFNRRDA